MNVTRLKLHLAAQCVRAHAQKSFLYHATVSVGKVRCLPGYHVTLSLCREFRSPFPSCFTATPLLFQDLKPHHNRGNLQVVSSPRSRSSCSLSGALTSSPRSRLMAHDERGKETRERIHQKVARRFEKVNGGPNC